MGNSIHVCKYPCHTSTCEKQELLNRIAELEQRIEQMQGEGFATAAELLNDWWNQANVQGTATMDGEELLEMCAEFQSAALEGK